MVFALMENANVILATVVMTVVRDMLSTVAARRMTAVKSNASVMMLVLKMLHSRVNVGLKMAVIG
jgi:hypothetical protein